MKARELKELGVDQLKEKLAQLNQPSVIQAARKDIARIKTILSEKAKA